MAIGTAGDRGAHGSAGARGAGTARSAVGRAVPGRAGAHRELLVERVDIGTDGADIRLRSDGLVDLVRDLNSVAESRSAA